MTNYSISAGLQVTKDPSMFPGNNSELCLHLLLKSLEPYLLQRLVLLEVLLLVVTNFDVHAFSL